MEKNAIDICKKHNLVNISQLFNYVLKLDYQINVIKNEMKVDLNFRNKEVYNELQTDIKILQGHANSLVAKREILTDLFDEIIANRIIRDLMLSTISETTDIEYKHIKVVCRKGGIEIDSKYHNGYFSCIYRNTKLYKTIKCN